VQLVAEPELEDLQRHHLLDLGQLVEPQLALEYPDITIQILN